MNITWKLSRSRSLNNLYVAYNDAGEAVGMVHKPRDSKTDKNFWRMYVGIGDDARFLGHAVSKREATNHVHWALELSNATVVVVDNRTKEQLGQHMQIF